jgi:hypothetical protein
MQTYKDLAQSHHFPFQAQPWWLDAVCGPGQWSAAVVIGNDDKPLAAMPYGKIGWKKMPIVRMPVFTTYFPIWLRETETLKRESAYHREAQALRLLVEQLPAPWIFDQQLDPDFSNGLPFYQQGFHLSTRYTYLIDDLLFPQHIFQEMEGNTRKNIRKAQRLTTINKQGSLEELYHLITLSFQRQGKKPPFSPKQLQIADACLAKRDMRFIYIASDGQNAHAGVYLVRDHKKTTLLLAGTHPQYRQSGALYFLLWEAIKDAAKYTPAFDFEGSMIPPIERVFRSFGARRVPYLRVIRYQNRLLAAAAALLGKNR